MHRINVVIAAALMSGVGLTSTLALAQASEPAAFQAQFPNRDVLNGGALTPAGRLGLERYDGASSAYAAQGIPSSAPVVYPRRRHRHQ
jgi:hypothetical protein